ncbi:hypothetical protein [Spiroplasma endosymbiont of Seladonia tumulorum]|uniref:hypothetical protein n=1 Tax=Spiroplasma endosymbiont of Seladonia tumulorum TaxID=3066321 RepID=UPI0030D346F1
MGIKNGGNHRTLYLYKLLINKEINELIFNVKNEINIENILKNIVVKNNNLIFLNCKKDNLNQVISILYNCRILMKIFYSLVMNR